MPEPDQKAVDADIYTRDTTDPFSIDGGHASIGRKFVFLMTGVFLWAIWGQTIIGHICGFTDYQHRYYCQGLGHYLSAFPPYGHCAFMTVSKASFRLGWRPQAFCMRNLCCGLVVVISWCGLNFVKITWSTYYMTFYSARTWDQPMEDYAFRVAYISPILNGFAMDHPHNYVDRSSYGRYCCASFPTARIMRVVQLSTLFVSLNFYMGRFLMIASAVGGFTSQVVAPLGIFTWKRMMFAFDITIAMHDTPYKGHANVIGIFYSIQALNLGVAQACVGVRNYADTSSFICVDWITFILRMVIVSRAGMNSCPRLLNFLIKKQLENVPSPMPKHVEAQGDKTAMRCVQAYLCLTEGETLTICYLAIALNYIFSWLCWQDTLVIYSVPMRDFFIILLFAVLDFIQDGLADTISKKFNDWSYLYMPGGWYSKKNLILVLIFAYAIGGEWMMNGPVAKGKLMNVMTMDVFIWPEWHWQTPSNLHL